MAKWVKSSDPRKPAIVAAFKRETGARKVTCIEEVRPGVFRADCLGKGDGRAFLPLGTFTLEVAV